jgi:RND family efflux transporter MFP subunit
MIEPTAMARGAWVATAAVWLGVMAGAAAGSPGTATPVTLAEVTREPLSEQAILSGTTIPQRRAALSPKVEGLVAGLSVDEGTLVEAGAPILHLDARLAELEVEAAEARVREAQARHQDAERVRDELLRLKQGRHASETEIAAAVAQVEMAAAALSAERAAAARAAELVGRHRLAAPFSGMVVAKHVEIGEWAKRDAAAVELVALETLRIRATLPEADFARVLPGAPATVRFDALPGRDFEGRVGARIAQGDDRTRTFPILIDIPNPDRLLAPGMSARVRVDLAGGTAEALTLPRDAVIAKSDGTREVWQVRMDDGEPKAYPITVETGRAFRERLELLGDVLDAGDRVVLLGNEGLRPGQSVAPEPDPTTAAAD